MPRTRSPIGRLTTRMIVILPGPWLGPPLESELQAQPRSRPSPTGACRHSRLLEDPGRNKGLSADSAPDQEASARENREGLDVPPSSPPGSAASVDRIAEKMVPGMVEEPIPTVIRRAGGASDASDRAIKTNREVAHRPAGPPHVDEPALQSSFLAAGLKLPRTSRAPDSDDADRAQVGAPHLSVTGFGRTGIPEFALERKGPTHPAERGQAGRRPTKRRRVPSKSEEFSAGTAPIDLLRCERSEAAGRPSDLHARHSRHQARLCSVARAAQASKPSEPSLWLPSPCASLWLMPDAMLRSLQRDCSESVGLLRRERRLA